MRSERLPLVHPRADRADHPLVAQLGESRDRLGDGLVQVLVRVVDVDDVDPGDAEPAKAGLEAAQHAVAAEVEAPDQVVGHREAAGFQVRPGRRRVRH